MLSAVFVCIAVINFSAANSVSNISLTRNKRSDDFIPCDNGWYYFNEKCYKAGGRLASDRLNWEKASERCKSSGGDLASIHSKEEQDFIVTFLQLDIKFYAWIGLHDHETELDFKWTDGSVVNYTDWSINEPYDGSGKEDCVQLLFEPHKDIVGKWNDNFCEFTDAYICEKKKNTKKKSPNRMYCSSAEGGGWKYQDSCYHIVIEPKSWENAEKHCKDKYNGHLVTVLDTTVDIFLDYILSNIKTEMWIGMKVQDQLQQKWISGWYAAYDGFSKEQNYVVGTCALRKNRREWITSSCSRKHSFICETSKVSAPVLKPPATGSYCPTEVDDWRDLGGEYCYYIEKEKAHNWYEASFECKRRGGDLASFHSDEESRILHPFVKYTQQRNYYEQSVFIGFYRLLADEKFAWSDGSIKDYENFASSEPNSVDEKCVEVSTHTMKWNDVTCETKRGYICAIKKIGAKSTTSEKTAVCACTALHSTAVEKSCRV